ncbi:MAG TPA: hypothetical protein VFC38_00065 [Stellaceae bacterium]|nr:hypothetical protein [Stellaceae bacterium]
MMNSALAGGARDALASLSVPVFLAGFDGAGPARVTLHVARPRNCRALRQEAQAALAAAGIDAPCRVRVLKYRQIERAQSLEGMLRPFAHDSLVYDPTDSVTRAQALLRCGGNLRRALGATLGGIYFEPESRTLYLVCRPEALARDGQIDKTLQRSVEAQTAPVIAAWRDADPGAFAFATRLCIAVPRLPLVPVDDSSPVERRAAWRRRLHSGMVAGGVATLLGALLPGMAWAEGPAVSAVNGKLSVEGGEGNAHPMGIMSGSLTVPLGYSFGGQLDVAGGGSNGQGLWGVAGQGFWRDPGMGLIGGLASYTDRGIATNKFVTTKDINVQRYGADGEAYLGQFTPSAAIGYQDGRVKHGAFATLDLAWYPLDDLQLSGGADLNPARSMALLGAEYQLGLAALPGLSTFAEAGISGSRASYALVGFRFYFGPAKTLIRRHREDDPPSLVTGGGFGDGFHNTSGNY